MKEYIIKEINKDGYDRFLLCLSFNSILSYLGSIESALGRVPNSGRMLIDQLLITGNNSNRFLSCSFSDGKLDFSTAHIVSPAHFFREETVVLLHENYGYVENSILTDSQRQNVKNKVAF